MRIRLALLAMLLVAVAAACDTAATPDEDGGDDGVTVETTLPATSPGL